MRADLFPQIITNEPWLYYEHSLRALPDGTALTALPFAGALYSMANGENHYMSAQFALNLIKKPKIGVQFFLSLYHKLLKSSVRLIKKKFKLNFTFYYV